VGAAAADPPPSPALCRYYSRIRTARLAELLSLPQDQVGRAGGDAERRASGGSGKGATGRTAALVVHAQPHGCAPRPALAAPQLEKRLAELVVAKAIAAKMDRPAGIVVFAPPPQPEAQLNAWAGNIGEEGAEGAGRSSLWPLWRTGRAA
jgi:hypothetical protein